MRVVLIAAVMIATLSRSANVVGETPSASSDARDYYGGEKRGGVVLMAMGAAGLGVGGLLIVGDNDLANGVSYATLPIGAVHAAAGIYIFLASKSRLRDVGNAMATEQSATVRSERIRANGALRDLTVLTYVEGALLLAGAGAAVAGFVGDRDRLAGFGIGLGVEAAATLIFDVIAKRRAVRYLDSLHLASAVGIGDGRLSLRLQVRF